jgi:hypothetical protein
LTIKSTSHTQNRRPAYSAPKCCRGRSGPTRRS